MDSAGRAAGRFLSLKWKALVLTSVPLIGIAISFAALSHFNQVRQHKILRQATYEQYTLQVSGLIEQSSQHLQQLGSLMLGLSDMQPPLMAGDARQLAEAFDKHWHYLQIDMGIEMVRFYSKSNELLGSWGPPEMQNEINSAVMGWIWHANEREEPVSIMLCNNNCIQFAIVPILTDGKNVGLILIGRSMADIILGFRQVSGTDIGVFVHGQGSSEVPYEEGKWLPGWGGRIVALTRSSETMAILQRVSDGETDLEKAAGGVQVDVSGRKYDVSLIPLNKFIHSGDASLVVVADISDAVARIDRNLKQSLIAGSIGLVVFEGLLLALLWAPLSRLRRTSSILPLLSRSAFEEAREAARVPPRRLRLEDESDILINTTISLSHQLEKLQDESSRHALALANRAEEMVMQKDFIASLVDTAQAIIITQNDRGVITMINQYGVSLLGYSEADLKNLPFIHFIAKNGQSMDLYHELADLSAGRRQELRHESSILCKDGSTREIAWCHSRPPGQKHIDSSVLSIGHDVTERKMAESRLAWLAEHDPLTGLYNRRRFQAELDDAIIQAKAKAQTGAMLFLDVDQFKDVNDSSGHQVGDGLIKEISGVLSTIVRDSDLVARIGGDEFAIVVRNIDAEGAIDLVRSIEKRLSQIILPTRGANHCVTASVGIALFPTHGDNVHDLLANADLAMYKAKDNGRGSWYMFSSADHIRERVQERVFWKTRLQSAIENDHFVLYFQPILDMKRNTIKHFEVLLRLKDHDGSLISPGLFIGIAEKIGMIHAIDRLVIRKAIAQLAALVRAGHDLNFSVNLSAHAFNDPELYDVIKDNLSEAGLEPGRVIFEVTETAAVTDFSRARACIVKVRELGCRFALDDFGVGFSSFFSLKELPIDYVKIDGSFIKNLDKNRDDQILVKALAQVADGFGKETIAEFVDSDRTLALLRGYGINYAQGYLLGIPLPFEEAFIPQRLDGFAASGGR